MVNIKNELDKMKEYKAEGFFKPKKGTQKIVFISEPVEDVWINPDGEKIAQLIFDVQVNKEDFKWSVTKGRTLTSLWGQLALASSVNDYKFNGLCVTVVVVGDGKDRRYTVLEAADLLEDRV